MTLFGHHLFTWKSASPKPMLVRNVVLAPPAPAPKPAPPAFAPKPKPKPAAPKPTPKKTEPPPAPKPAPPKKRSELTLPSPIPQKPQIATPSEDPNYAEFLISYLQNALDLPEYGDVKVKLEIDRYGHLTHCEILQAKSQKNADFLKNRLPELSFPCLNESQSFTITFRNVEVR